MIGHHIPPPMGLFQNWQPIERFQLRHNYYVIASGHHFGVHPFKAVMIFNGKILKLRKQTSDWSQVSLYIQKLELITNVDPFEIGKGTADEFELPLVDASDIVSYLVLQTSFITAQQYKAHRPLEAYNQCTSECIKDLCAYSAWVISKSID